MNKFSHWRAIAALFLLLTVSATAAMGSEAGEIRWFDNDAQGEPTLDLYFFWSNNCPHCQDAKPVVERLAAEYRWLRLHSFEVLGSRENMQRYSRMAGLLGREARSVPAFLFCGQMEVGFDGRGEMLRQALGECYQAVRNGEDMPVSAPGEVVLPVFGKVDGDSLFLVTVVIAALDAFNPCAFFVLLFLLSLLVNTRSRRRMLFIGGVFVFFSGAFYFLFMAAWLNLFLLAGMQQLFTLAAGAVAVVMAFINIKDFFLPGRGLSLSIPEAKKPGLFQRMRGLLQADNLPALTLGTVTLAVAANSYELLCTSGLPMVYTRVLTLEGLTSTEYYLYLLLYNLIYVIPLLTIVLLFTITLGRRKLQPEEGRLLKLLSGTMMLGLGAGLLFAPQLLGSVIAVLMVILVAISITLVGAWWLRSVNNRGGRGGS
ncbi:MAG: thioredoxin family protein [Gammaproteobacteria bacterium]|nr:thioredoxin family protein [Gammaproteobacteria bacterium]MCW8841415.1 thioredoxin family protein [Gammaproteobacteria bacterium]MCW8927319.1 thioredoxin family protein [Gammaproteobacteria bacterium]MCW8958076.1 thioredoxin family protein [Gammaproteobacteria bacterium]MCW8971684.1 thioredoxin family protein [Gammaproteobacteria bacterium]